MIDQLITIAQEAGAILKEGFYGTKNVTNKGSKDLVTEFDVKVENFIIEKIKAAFPAYGIVAEESALASDNPDKIIIDPIDGTTNFVHGIPNVAISIGLFKDNIPTAGVVYNPIQNELYHAVKGEGAYRNGERIGVTDETRFKHALIATGFPYTIDKSKSDFEWNIKMVASILPDVQDIRRLGAASLDLCYVARGSFEGYYEMNLKPWDVAAGIVIVQEAGGVVTDQNGEQYDPLRDRIIVVSNGKIHDRMIGYLRD
jgi:myo-inositol-1(or 4)-monophosphatase